MIKRILVPIDPSPYTDSSIQFAISVAKRNNAEITGLVILDIPGIEKSIGAVPLGASFYAKHLEDTKKVEAKQLVDKLITNFETKCKDGGVKYKAANRQGSPSDWIVKESGFYDLIVIGLRTFFHFETQDSSGDSLEKIMGETATPVYAVPEKLKLPEMNSNKIKALIAFDGSLQASKALQRFASLSIPELMQVILVNSSDDKESGQYYLNEAENYLKAHSFNEITKDLTSEDIIEYIKDKYINNVDVFVVGTHSKKGILDFFIGSLTKYLIKLNEKPVLIG